MSVRKQNKYHSHLTAEKVKVLGLQDLLKGTLTLLKVKRDRVKRDQVCMQTSWLPVSCPSTTKQKCTK